MRPSGSVAITNQANQAVSVGHRYFTPSDVDADVRRSLQTMSRWQGINDGHHHEKRVQQRNEFPSKIVLSVTIPSSPAPVLFPVWGRNLSASGVAALCSSFLKSLNASDNCPLLALPALHEQATAWQCGLCLSSTEFRWMDCRIVRLRALPNRMFDLGVEFQRKSASFPTDLAPEFLQLLQTWMDE